MGRCATVELYYNEDLQMMDITLSYKLQRFLKSTSQDGIHFRRCKKEHQGEGSVTHLQISMGV